MIEIDISENSFRDVERFLDATPKQIDKAMSSTFTKLARWLTTKSVRELAKVLKLPPKEVKRRLRTFRLARSGGGKAVRVWYGLDPMGMIHLGAKQTKEGVTAFGDRFVKSAFIARGRAGRGPASDGNRQVFIREGRTRLPIKKVTVELGDQAQTYIEDHILGSYEFTERFFTIFERELKWRTTQLQ